MNRQMILELDEDDYTAIQQAMATRQTFRAHGWTGTILPDGESNLSGALVAEICRGWCEFIERARREER